MLCNCYGILNKLAIHLHNNNHCNHNMEYCSFYLHLKDRKGNFHIQKQCKFCKELRKLNMQLHYYRNILKYRDMLSHYYLYKLLQGNLDNYLSLYHCKFSMSNDIIHKFRLQHHSNLNCKGKYYLSKIDQFFYMQQNQDNLSNLLDQNLCKLSKSNGRLYKFKLLNNKKHPSKDMFQELL